MLSVERLFVSVEVELTCRYHTVLVLLSPLNQPGDELRGFRFAVLGEKEEERGGALVSVGMGQDEFPSCLPYAPLREGQRSLYNALEQTFPQLLRCWVLDPFEAVRACQGLDQGVIPEFNLFSRRWGQGFSSQVGTQQIGEVHI